MKVPFKLPDSSVIQKKNYYSPQAKQILWNTCKPLVLISQRLFPRIEIIVVQSLLTAYVLLVKTAPSQTPMARM